MSCFHCHFGALNISVKPTAAVNLVTLLAMKASLCRGKYEEKLIQTKPIMLKTCAIIH